MTRLNIHQSHLESLVMLGSDGLEEINYKINHILSDDINYSTKIDGSPSVYLWSHIDGYPDNSICLKSFVRGPENALSTIEEIEEKYSDRPEMTTKLIACLRLAKSIPAYEAWQGDCLFTANSLRQQTILGKEYLTFQPNKIIYALSENSPSYNKVKRAIFGICFHTIYKGTANEFTQSFKVNLDELNNVPDNFYFMTPAMDKPKEINISKDLLSRFLELKEVLEADPNYEEIVNNLMFMKYWNMFENKFISDKATITLDLDTFEDDLKDFISDRLGAEYEKKQATLKTDSGKEKARSAYEKSLTDLNDLITNNSTLRNMVDCLNTVAKIKMQLIKALPNKTEYDTFFNSKSKGFIPTTGEGIAMSDSEGNIVKLVDRSTFSNANRDDDILRGFEEDLNEKLEGAKKTAVVAFGRLNPMTTAHGKLAKKLELEAQKVNGDALLYLSHSQDKKKNPLDYQTKLRFCRKAFPNIEVVESDAKTLINVLEELNGKYTDIIYVCGEDRLEGPYSADKVLTAYNNIPDKSGKINYSYNSINFVSAGNRNTASDDKIETISGTMARQFAIDNDFESFEDVVPFDGLEAKELFNAVRKGLGLEILKEELLNPDKHYIVHALNKLFSHESYIETLQNSSRHPLEVARIKPSGITDTELINKVKELISAEFENAIIGDYDFHNEASGTYKSLELDIDGHSYFITVSTKAKKEFTPIKLLRDLKGSFDYNIICEKIHYDKDEEVEQILQMLAYEATTAKANDQTIIKNNIKYKDSDGFVFSFNAPETVKRLSEIEPEKYNLIESGLRVDFAEVFGAIGLAASIDKAVGGNIVISYPTAANAKLLDYIISVNGNEYKISAKTGGGARPSSTCMFEAIHSFLYPSIGEIYSNPDLQDGISFCDWFYTSVTQNGVNDSYKRIADEVADIAAGNYSNWRNVFKGIPNLDYIGNLYNGKHTEQTADQLASACNELARNLGGNLVKPITDNYRQFIDQYFVRCLVSLFVNVINTTHNEAEDGLIDQVNELFKKSYGSLIQVYAHPNLTKGYFTFDVVYFTDNIGRYKFNNNIGLDKSGRFTNQKLAVELVK